MKFNPRIGVFWLVAILSVSCTVREVTTTTKETTMGRNDEGLDDQPQRVTGWSKSDTLKVGQSKKATMQADFGVGGNFTVQFDRVIPPDYTADESVIQTFAEITWSIAGNSMVRRVSVGPGVTVSGVAEAVRVVCWDATVQGAEQPPLDVGFEYQVSIAVGPGTRSALPFPPTYVDHLGPYTVAQNVTTNVAIPQGIGVTSVRLTVVKDSFLAIVPGQCQAALLFQVGTLCKAWRPEEGEEWVTIPPGCRTLSMRNSAGSGNNMLFHVEWGIDG